MRYIFLRLLKTIGFFINLNRQDKVLLLPTRYSESFWFPISMQDILGEPSCARMQIQAGGRTVGAKGAAQSRFAIVVLESVLGPLRLAHHT